MVPGAPETMFWALGLGEQVIAVVPGEDIVAVRLGDRPPPRPPVRLPRADPGVLEAADPASR